MKVYAIVAAVLIAAGIVALAYGGFSYTKESESANLGPIELTINEKKTVNVPVWAGVGAIVLGVATLAFPLIKQTF